MSVNKKHFIYIFILAITSCFFISCSNPVNNNSEDKLPPAIPEDSENQKPNNNDDYKEPIDTTIPLWEKGYTGPMVKQIEEAGGSVYDGTLFTDKDVEIISNLVGQASSRIAEKFPKTFGYLQEANVGLGLSGGRGKSDGSRALVVINVGNSKYQVPPTWEYVSDVFTSLTLELLLDIALPGVEGGNPIQGNEKAIKELEYLMSHEIMHAIMGTTFSMGMTSFHIDGFTRVPESMFPIWFKEGTAVVTGGLVNGDLGSMLSTHNLNGDLNSIVAKLKEYNISRDDETASYTSIAYASGYLACMYIGYIVSEYQADHNFTPESITSDSDVIINENRIREGLDLYMSKVAQGYSLTDALNKLAGTSYNNFDEFEEAFPSIPAAAFSKALNKKIGNGIGSLLNDSLTDTSFDFYDPSKSLMYAPLKLIPNAIKAQTYYNDIVVVKGGGKDSTGYSRHGSYPSDAIKPPYGYDSQGTTPYLFNPYRLFTDTTITFTLSNINKTNLSESIYNVAIKENDTSRHIINEKDAIKINNVSWYKGNKVTNTPINTITEKGNYTIRIELEGKGFIKEEQASNPAKHYPLYGRFIGTNDVILSYNGNTNKASVVSNSPFSNTNSNSNSYSNDPSYSVILKDNETRIVITKTFTF